MTGLSWNWIALASSAPLLVALAVAALFWRKSQAIFGNIVGTGIVFGSGVAMILREYVVLDRGVQACLEVGVPCWPVPSAFTRFAIYAFIALIEVFILFSLSLRVEERIRRRDYAPEWR
jgi:hypothetical protein